MFSTSGDVQYIGGCSVHKGDTMSTLGDIMSTLGGVQYIGDIMMHVGDIMMHVGDIMSTSVGYHDACWGIP